MRIDTLPLTDLKPAPYNPRVALEPGDSRYQKLKRSLEKFGLVEPLIWNRQTGHLVGGHQRFRILQDLGHEEAAVSVVDLSPEKEKALNVVLNNRLAQGDWNLPRLTEVLEELSALPESMLAETGFLPAQLATLRSELTPVEEVPVEQFCAFYEVVLRIPQDRMEEVRPELDELVGKFGIEVHVRQR